MLTVFVLILLVSITAICFAIYGSKFLDGLTPKTMYRVAGCLVIASIISGSISLMAIFLALDSPDPKISNLDVIVDVLGVLVTVLMGWNIISVVDFKRRAEKLEHITGDFQHVILGILRLNIKSFMMIGEKHRLLDNCVSSLDEIRQCKDEGISKLATNEIMLLLYKLIEAMDKDKDAFVCKGKKPEYEHVLKHIDNAYSGKIIEKINDADEKDVELTSELNLYKPSEPGQGIHVEVQGETLVITGTKADNSEDNNRKQSPMSSQKDIDGTAAEAASPKEEDSKTQSTENEEGA